MENLQQSWKQTTAALYKAVMIYTLAGVAVSVFTFILTITITANVFSAISAGDVPSVGGLGVWSILNILATIAIVYGYWLFLRSLTVFAGLVAPADAPRIGTIRTATIVSLVGVIVACIPIVSFAGGILNLIAWIMLLMAYANLKDSPTFPALARTGAGRVFLAMILGVLGWLLGWIPVVGAFITLILSIIAFFLVLSGWKTISQSEAPVVQ